MTDEELLEAAAEASLRAAWDEDSGPCPPWCDVPDVLKDLYRVSTHAALEVFRREQGSMPSGPAFWNGRRWTSTWDEERKQWLPWIEGDDVPEQGARAEAPAADDELRQAVEDIVTEESSSTEEAVGALLSLISYRERRYRETLVKRGDALARWAEQQGPQGRVEANRWSLGKGIALRTLSERSDG
jgi:hypothetical protein